MKFLMKKISAQALLCLSIAAMSGHVMAADSTINIAGTVVSEGCSVNPPTVVIPDIDVSKLATPGTASDYVPFTVDFTGCSSAVSYITFSYGTAGGTADNLYWANTGTATNVSLEIMYTRSSGTEVAVRPDDVGSTQTINSTTLSTALNYKVRVLNTGKAAATAGTVIGGFSIIYSFV